MYKNLKNLMAQKDISVEAMAKLLNVTTQTVRNKLNGETEFTFGEVELIMECMFPEYNYKFVFRRETDAA